MKKQLMTLPFYATAFVLTGACGTVAGAAALAGDRRGRIWWPASLSLIHISEPTRPY